MIKYSMYKKWKLKHRDLIEKIIAIGLIAVYVYIGWTWGRVYQEKNQEERRLYAEKKECETEWDDILRKIKCDGSKCEYRY